MNRKLTRAELEELVAKEDREEEEREIRILNAKNKFWSRLGWITAKALASVPEEDRDELSFQLSDSSSIYSTDYAKKLKFLLEQRRIKSNEAS